MNDERGPYVEHNTPDGANVVIPVVNGGWKRVHLPRKQAEEIVRDLKGMRDLREYLYFVTIGDDYGRKYIVTDGVLYQDEHPEAFAALTSAG